MSSHRTQQSIRITSVSSGFDLNLSVLTIHTIYIYIYNTYVQQIPKNQSGKVILVGSALSGQTGQVSMVSST